MLEQRLVRVRVRVRVRARVRVRLRLRLRVMVRREAHLARFRVLASGAQLVENARPLP